jgi:hypothetical protein
VGIGEYKNGTRVGWGGFVNWIAYFYGVGPVYKVLAFVIGVVSFRGD